MELLRSSIKGRRLERLTEKETISSFNSWKQNLEFQLMTCADFVPFLVKNFKWKPQKVNYRGLTDDDESVPVATRKLAIAKHAYLDHMIRFISSYCPEHIQSEIERKCTSLDWIWQRIRRHYGFSQSEVHFLKLSTIKLEKDERHETFFQRIMAHLYDNLLSAGSIIKFDGEEVTENEEMSPTVERLAVFLWLHFIDERLPEYISRIYAKDLQSHSIKDLQPQISMNINSIIQDLNTQEDIKIQFSAGRSNWSNSQFPRKSSQQSYKFGKRQKKTCAYCKAINRTPYVGHDVKSCWIIPKEDKANLIKAFSVISLDSDESDAEIPGPHDCDSSNVHFVEKSSESTCAGISRVECMASPHFFCHIGRRSCKVTVDTGAMSNLISLELAKSCNLRIQQSQQRARQLDGTPLKVCGEVTTTLHYGSVVLNLNALVIEVMDSDVLAGIPFCKSNALDISFTKDEIYFQGKTVKYGSSHVSSSSSIRMAMSHILRNPSSTVLYPGEFIDFDCPTLSSISTEVAVEPRLDSPAHGGWPEPSIIQVVDGTVRLSNNLDQPLKLNKNQQVGNARSLISREELQMNPPGSVSVPKSHTVLHSAPFSTKVCIDSGKQLTKEEVDKFRQLNIKYDKVFDPNYTGYNDFSGTIRAKVNVASTPPPPQKARLPFYDQKNLVLLQEHADLLEDKGVLVTPESLGMVAIHVSPSFLVNKPNGDKRFVTAFNSLAKYCRPPPSRVYNCRDVLQRIGASRFIIKTDLTASFFQIKIDPDSMPYLGTMTPFKGIRLYARAAMGMPGSTEYLEELMSRVLGHLQQDGNVAKIHDDLYAFADSIDKLFTVWEEVLSVLSDNNLSLSAEKTEIVPASTTLLGWTWQKGCISATSHKLSPLAATAEPSTCTAMRSFLGAYKAIARCIPRCSSYLSPLEDSIKGLKGGDHIKWTPSLSAAFSEAKEVLKDPKSLTLPCPEDKVCITVDASPLNRGLGATMFINRDGHQKIAEFFSFKLKEHQCKWQPCELEGLAISSAATHFAPYIRESRSPAQILTDSKPCVEAWNKLQRGQFSASARVSTFLSTLASLNVALCHIKGTDNIISDFGSRNPLSCHDSNCQICKFVKESVDSVVRSISISDVLEGNVRMPFLSQSSWRSAQQSDHVCRTAFSHLINGTRPSKKTNKDSREVKAILRSASVNRNKTLLIVRKQDPYVGSRELIYCPKEISSGLILAIHLMFNHASKSQLKKLYDRYFFSTGSSKAIDDVVNDCITCNSLKKVPRELFTQSTSITSTPGKRLSADVMRRAGQKILVVRDMLTSFTSATFTNDETAAELRDALIVTCLPLQFQSSTIKVDCAPSLRSLRNDSQLLALGIEVDLGNEKNPNKNPVADKAIQELELELLKLTSSSSAVSATSLVQAICNLNSRIRHSNLSAKEMLLGRDQIDGRRLRFSDKFLSSQQNTSRITNHVSSAKSKARGGSAAKKENIAVGSLVFIKHEGNKFNPRESYVVVEIKDELVRVQKMNKGKFFSRQYEVPMSRVFPCVASSKPEDEEKEVIESTLSSSDDDIIAPPRQHRHGSLVPDASTDSEVDTVFDSDSSQDSDEDSDSNDNSVPAEVPTRRSSRAKRSPTRYGDPVNYDSTRSLPGENDVTQPWWPGYPRGSFTMD